jgi:hypothetical protein
MKRLVVAAAVAVSAALTASGATGTPARDALVRPGLAVGKVRLGMSFAEVRRAVGRPQLVNRQLRVGFGRTYVEYAWDYGELTVGFFSQRGRLRAARISTTSPRERTGTGLRLGSRPRDIARRYSNATCRYKYPPGVEWVTVEHPSGRQTLFVIELDGIGPVRRRVNEIVVKEPFPEYWSPPSRFDHACPRDWRTR